MGRHLRPARRDHRPRPRSDDHPRLAGGRASRFFNIRIRKELAIARADAVIGFDLDGVFAPRGKWLHVAAIKGVIADEAKHERGMSRIALAIEARLERCHVHRADRVITTSTYSAGRIAKFYGMSMDKIAIVPELIDLDAWERTLSEAPREEGPPRILYVAHLYPRKGVDTLLRAFAHVSADAVLRVVGIGPERGHLEHLAHRLGIADRVAFLGHLPFAALAAEYRNADDLRAADGAGRLRHRLPRSDGVVASDHRHTSGRGTGGRATDGLLVDPGDEAALTESIERLLGDVNLRAKLGNAGSNT